MQDPLAIAPAGTSDPAPALPPPLAPALTAVKFSDADLQAMARLPRPVCEDVLRWHRLFAPLLPANGAKRTKNITAKLADLARQTGVPLVTVRRYYYRLLKEGWRGLVNQSKAGPAWQQHRGGKPPTLAERPAFVDFWRRIMQQYQGRDETGKAAHGALQRRLAAWEVGDEKARIPGYDAPPAREPFTGLPAGWSYENLMRPQHKLPDDEAAAAKYGRGALAKFRLPVLSTRYGLKIGQVVVFDDQEVDVRTNFLGVARQSFRPLCFDAQDYLSAAQPLHGFKPVLVDDATGKNRTLSEKDFRWFVVAYLGRVGYRPDTGTTLIVERGTAAIRPDFEARILHVTAGLVTVSRGGITGAPTFAGMFEGTSRGNFRFKATLEVARVRLRNEMAALPGSVGKDRNHAPEGDFGLDRYNQKLLNAAVALPPELAARLQYPILNWHEFVAVAREIHRLIDARTEHDLEGWERCEFIRHEYRLSLASQEWIEAKAGFGAMDVPQRAAMRARIEATPGLWRTRKLAPQEVWDAGKGELVTVPDHALAMLLEADDARHGERCESNRLFILKDRTIDAEPLHFDASALIRQGLVRPGERYSVYLNPFDAARLIVCDGALRYLGTAPLWDRIPRLDRGEASRRLAHIRQDQSACLDHLARRGADQTRRMLGMREGNAALVAGRTPSTDARAAAILQAAEDAALLDGGTLAGGALLSLPERHTAPLALEYDGQSDLDLL